MPWGEDGRKGQGPWGKNPVPPEQQPDFDELLKKARDKFNNTFGGGDNKKAILLASLVAVILWLASGAYIIEPEEQGVVLRFGAYHRIADPGLNYHIPAPVENVIKVPFTVINRVEVGVRSSTSRRGVDRNTKIPEESLMLTGDENIIDIDFEVQWKVRDAAEFLFNVRNPADTVKSLAESAMREVVGRTRIADALTEGRLAIELETKNIIQEMLNYYKAGIEIVRLQMREVQPPAAVIDAFRDVQTARADMERAQNEAETYRNDILPRARGEAEKVIQGAEGYKQQVIAKSQGEASRFISIYNQYKEAKEVTKKRMYLETMEEILQGMTKILIDNKTQGTGVVPFLPLSDLNKRGNK